MLNHFENIKDICKKIISRKLIIQKYVLMGIFLYYYIQQLNLSKILIFFRRKKRIGKFCRNWEMPKNQTKFAVKVTKKKKKREERNINMV